MTAPSSVTFADLLRHHRTAAGLTQEELAARAGLSSDAVSTLERGARRRPRKDTVALLAEALALPEEERAALAAAARRSSAAALAATPPAEAAGDLNGHAPDLDGHARDAALDATLPHGAVTFLIAEVEDPSRLLHALGDRYAGLLAEVQTLLGTVWAAHAGHELGTQGDRFFAVFAYADDALAAAAAAQHALAAHNWPDGAQVRLHMGLHSGAALLTAGRYVGQEVHRAACIAAAGHGGQIVVSEAMAEQVAKFGYELPDGTRLRSLGKHRLQGLPHREELYELVLPDAPGLPATYPPLRTLDAWPGLRADLTVVVGMSAVLLAVVGLVLELVVPAFPWAIGLGAAGLALLILLAAVLAQPVRRALETQWRDARKPVSAVTSTLLSLVVVVTTLFITKPTPVTTAQRGSYDFSYSPYRPTHTGGNVVIATGLDIHTLTSPILNGGLPDEGYRAVWSGCLVQLPDLHLPGLNGWKADQCSEVPTVANQEEDPAQNKWTIFHIDPRAVWSDGTPLTAADFLFALHLVQDPNVNGTVWICGCPNIYPPWSLMHLTMLDTRTVRIDWDKPYGDYLSALAQLTPVPLHVYAQGPFAGVYTPATDAYNSSLAQRMAAQDNFNLHLPVDNGPFTVERIDGYPGAYQATTFSSAQAVVLARNPHYFSNYFHYPTALDHLTLTSPWTPYLFAHPERFPAAKAALRAAYQQGSLTVDDAVDWLDLGQLGGIPPAEVVSSPVPTILTLGFNQRDVAPSARGNGGVSLFKDPTLRRAFVEAFDRCGALKAVLGLRDCADPNFHTDEHAVPSDLDYDATVTLPPYNPTDADKLLTQAGYLVVDKVRRYQDGTTPLVLTISLSNGGKAYVDLAKRLQQDYHTNLHIAVQLEQPLGQLFGGTGVTGAFDIGMWREDVGPDPVNNLAGWSFDAASIPSTQNPNGRNMLGLIDPWVVAQDTLATQESDGAQRAEIYKGMVRHVTEQLDYLPLLIAADIVLVKPTLCNFKKWPAYDAYLWNVADWYLTHGSTCP